MENCRFIMQALEEALRDNALTIQYLRDKRKQAEERETALIVKVTELEEIVKTQAKLIEEQAKEIKNLEGDLDFYKPANCKTEVQAQ